MSKAVVAMMAAGTAMSAYGIYQQGKAQKKMYEYNQTVQNQNAAAVMDNLTYQKDIHAQRLRKIKGTQRVLFSKAGVSLQFTPTDLEEDTIILAAQDEVAMEYNAKMKARGYTAEAELSGLKGRMAKLQGITGATSTLLGGGAETMKTGYALT